MWRRHFLMTIGAALAAPAAHARQVYRISDAERMVAAIQDGGKVIYWLPDGNAGQAQLLGRALRALRAPLNEILTGRADTLRQAAEAAFTDLDIRGVTELDFRPDELLRMPPPPGHNRLLVGSRPPLEAASGQRFPASSFPAGSLAIFLPATEITLLGTVTAARVIAAAQARGALPR